MKSYRPLNWLALAFFLAAGASYFWISPETSALTGSYERYLQFDATSFFRESPQAEWQEKIVSVSLDDQVLRTRDDVLIIQSHLLWAAETGEVVFQNIGLYGVDRRTRQNVSGYGDASRQGQFLFPPHFKRAEFTLWDAQFIGPRLAQFDHSEVLEGLKVDVYTFELYGLDESEGYSYLADVPELYLALTDGHGKLWIEPLSGVVIDYFEQGASYFIDKRTGDRLPDFYLWSIQFKSETKAQQLALARSARLRLSFFEAWLPGALLTAAMFLLAVVVAHPVPNHLNRLTF